MAMATDEHRIAVTQAIGPDLPLRVLRRDPARGLALCVGLWALWWSGDAADGGTDRPPDGLKVVLATAPAAAWLNAPSISLADVPWTVLQMQAVSPNDAAWTDISNALAADVAAQTPGSTTSACTGALVHDTQQTAHRVRTVKNADALAAYTIERVDAGAADTSAARPMESVFRSRVEYRVFRGREGSLHAEDGVRVFIERPMPKHQHTSQRLHSETGLERMADLLSAVQTWRTWIVLL